MSAGGSASGSENGSSTFLFADLAGFTALTEAHGDARAVEIATRFEEQVRELLPAHGAEEIKTIGDEVMIRVGRPSDAVALGLEITHRLAAHGKPPVRVGMHSGPAVRRDGDWLGATVNLASRVTGAARPGEVLLTDATRRALDEHGRFEIAALGSRQFKNVRSPVLLYRARASGEPPIELAIDPVCRMAVDPRRAPESHRRAGVVYDFCSEDCASAFSAAPRTYLPAGGAAGTARRRFLIDLTAFGLVAAVLALHLRAARGSSEPRRGSRPPNQ